MRAGFRIRQIVAVACILEVTTQAPPAAADGPPDALVHEGVELRRANHDAEALAVFERALAIDGSPRTRAQVALAEQALGLWVEAERDLDKALAQGGGDWFEQHASALHSAQDTVRAHLASLHLTSNVAGAEVRINGVVTGVTPLAAPLRVVAGTAVVDIRAPNFAPKTVSVQLDPASSRHESIDLVPLPGSGDVSRPVHDPPLRDFPTKPESVSPGRGAGAWIALGGGIVLLGTAALAWTSRNSNVALYDDDSRCFYGGESRDARCGNYRTAADAAQVVSIVALGAAVAALSWSTVLFLQPSRGPAAGGIAVRCSAGASLGCIAHF